MNLDNHRPEMLWSLLSDLMVKEEGEGGEGYSISL